MKNLIPSLCFFIAPSVLATPALNEIGEKIFNDDRLNGSVVTVCIEKECLEIDKTMVERRKKLGTSGNHTSLRPDNKDDLGGIVGEIVGGVTSKASVGASISVNYEHTTTNPDGTTETTKVNVKVNAGNGEAGSVAAGK